MGEGYTGGRTLQTSLGKQYFLLIRVRFGLRGLKEQYELRRYPDSQINIVKINGKDALVYREFQSKTRQGGYLTGAKIQQGCLIVFVQG